MIIRWDQIPTFLFLVVSSSINTRDPVTTDPMASAAVRNRQHRAQRSELAVVLQDNEKDVKETLKGGETRAVNGKAVNGKTVGGSK